MDLAGRLGKSIARGRPKGHVLPMQYLGVMRGSGVLACGEEQMGRADYDIDGFLTRPGEVVGSGEIRMSPEALNHAFGRLALRLTTDDGRVLDVRFSGKRLDPASDAAHADISGQLPAATEWRRGPEEDDSDQG
jgi:hypothetical protein